ncbi:hypothetical protein Ancab_005040 [Ancistrocladus abbreviatus]
MESNQVNNSGSQFWLKPKISGLLSEVEECEKGGLVAAERVDSEHGDEGVDGGGELSATPLGCFSEVAYLLGSPDFRIYVMRLDEIQGLLDAEMVGWPARGRGGGAIRGDRQLQPLALGLDSGRNKAQRGERERQCTLTY